MENHGPEFLRFAIPIINVLKKHNNQGKPKIITDEVIELCDIPEEDLNEKLKRGGSRIKNQVHWARFYLMKSGHIDSMIKGTWKLTDKAINSELTQEDIYALFKEVRKNWNEKEESDIEDETSEEIEDENKAEEIHFDEFFKKVNFEYFTEHQPLSLSDPQRIKIQEIITKCENTNWVIPHFQRYFDWNKTNVKELLESIFYEYYVGAFLLWRTGSTPELGIQPILGKNIEIEKLNPNEIILDGQQRITAIYYAIKAPNEIIKGSKKRLFFYINFQKYLTNEEKTDIVEIHTSKLTDETTFSSILFPIFQLDKYQSWIDGFEDYLLTKKIDDELIRKLRRIIEKKLNYFWSGFEIPYISLPSQIGLNEVTDIFENINTKGKLLNVFDLLIARLYKYDIELKTIWDNTLDSFPLIKKYFTAGKINKIPIYILQALSLTYTKSSTAKRADILDIYSLIYEDNDDRIFGEDWEDISLYMESALERMENMKDGFGVRSEKDLPFAPMIPVLTALLKASEEYPNKIDCNKKIKIWYWSAVFTTAYSSAADSQMTNDFREVRNWFKNNSEEPKTVSNFKKLLPSLDFYDIQSTSNAKYKGILSLIALNGAIDLNTGLTLENSKDNDKDHIFPKSMPSLPSKYKNSILNMTWMSDKTNRKIKKCKKPSLYLEEFLKEKYNSDEKKLKSVLKTHLINNECYQALRNDEFEKFIDLRQQNIIEYLSAVTEIKIDKSNTKTLISSKTPFSNRIAFISTLSQCNEYIYWLDKYFSTKGMEYISDSLDEISISEIKIIMTIEKVDEKFRNLFKHFKDEMKEKNINVQLHVLSNSKIKSSIHDRFIISKDIAFNIPSLDIIARNQLSEITKSENHDSLINIFNDIWNNTQDLINDWNDIRKNIEQKN